MVVVCVSSSGVEIVACTSGISCLTVHKDVRVMIPALGAGGREFDFLMTPSF